MADREKVIRGLECCMSESLCYKCPYKSKDECENGKYYYSKSIEDAIALLREQEARVMTADEVQPDELVWIEVPQSDEIWPALLRRSDWFDDPPTWEMCGYALAAYYPHEGYGRDWRCWTDRPTDEQREAVKWDET